MANINRDDAPQSNKSFQFSIWKRLGPFIKPYRWLLLLIIVTNIIIWTTLSNKNRCRASRPSSSGTWR